MGQSGKMTAGQEEGAATSPLPGSGFTLTLSLHDFRPNGAKTKSAFGSARF
jgi:hypothetical protein